MPVLSPRARSRSVGLCRRGRPAAGHAGRVRGEAVANGLGVTDDLRGLLRDATRDQAAARTAYRQTGARGASVGVGALGRSAAFQPRSTSFAVQGCSPSSARRSFSQFERS